MTTPQLSREEIKRWVERNTYDYKYCKLTGNWSAHIVLPQEMLGTIEPSIEKIYEIFTELIIRDEKTYNMLCSFLKQP